MKQQYSDSFPYKIWVLLSKMPYKNSLKAVKKVQLNKVETNGMMQIY